MKKRKDQHLPDIKNFVQKKTRRGFLVCKNGKEKGNCGGGESPLPAKTDKRQKVLHR